eukprot:gnl/Spiro4/25385_TR12654_c0_g1_i1.p1 gnl/Spiro4/25385_TR12654_c0_g1~~gnl/Spiro4/25385_TR12654_c0_g1_i1.p1  ORF type:complete len:106 (+),score=8.99 gnl/Spiro4/25385_TR12654_c0_g1_i1:95-412(+)
MSSLLTDADKKIKEAQLLATINQRMAESGERDRLKERLRSRLTESGWRDNMKSLAQEHYEADPTITVDALAKKITARGRATVPDSIKAELLQRIRAWIESVSRSH